MWTSWEFCCGLFPISWHFMDPNFESVCERWTNILNTHYSSLISKLRSDVIQIQVPMSATMKPPWRHNARVPSSTRPKRREKYTEACRRRVPVYSLMCDFRVGRRRRRATRRCWAPVTTPVSTFNSKKQKESTTAGRVLHSLPVSDFHSWDSSHHLAATARWCHRILSTGESGWQVRGEEGQQEKNVWAR